MISIYIFSLLMAVALATPSHLRRLEQSEDHVERDLGSDKEWYDYVGSFLVTVTNLSFQQPMSPFFALLHSDVAPPLYQQGEPASEALAILAEDGNGQPLVDMYQMNTTVGVIAAEIVTEGPLMPSMSTSFQVTTTFSSPYVSLASMAINTNDCFVGIAGTKLFDGMVLDLPGLDAGSEENNELCSSIPGPACADVNTTNVRSGNGEGFVHVHRGFFGVGPDLTAAGYDWRNPMLRITVDRI